MKRACLPSPIGRSSATRAPGRSRRRPGCPCRTAASPEAARRARGRRRRPGRSRPRARCGPGPPGSSARAGVLERARRETARGFLLDLQPGRHPVAAEALQVLGGARQPGVQVVRRDAARRAAAAAGAVEPDQHEGAVVALDQARGDDPDHAGVPPSPASTWTGSPSRSGADASCSSASIRMPVSTDCRSVLTASSSRAISRARLGVVGEHQLQPRVGAVQTAGRVDPRGEARSRASARSTLWGSTPATRISSRRPGRCAPARARRPLRTSVRFSPRAAPGRRPSRAPRGRARARARPDRGRGAEERLGELVCDAGGAQLRARIAARRPGARSGSRAAASPGRWWSVTITSIPSERANATSSTAPIPQSTVTSRPAPRARSSSTVAATARSRPRSGSAAAARTSAPRSRSVRTSTAVEQTPSTS